MDAELPAGAKPFEFRGNAKEWFGIWIVNLLLSIVTIGIYSAWAKVRTKKYFYNNTTVVDRNFDYHATGKQILIGRIIVLVGFIIFQVVSSLNPIIALVMLLVLMAVLPWLIVRSMQFNARMSSFSNVRFGFGGSVGRAFVVFILAPIGAYILIAVVGGIGAYLLIEEQSMLGILPVVITFVGLFVMFPFIDRLVKQFSINNHRLGVSGFHMDVPLGPFLKAALLAAGWVVLSGLVFAIVFGTSIAAFFGTMQAGAEPSPAQIGVILLLYIGFFLIFLPASFIYQAVVRNVVYNNTTLEGGHGFVSNVSPWKLFWIALSNAVVVICTLFLMLPWAQVRIAKYLASHTWLLPGSSLDEFVSDQQERGAVIGDAYTDLDGFDVGLPV